MEERLDPVPSTPASLPAAVSLVQVPDHELIRLIGRGSYGEVWLGQSTLGSYRAIKIVYEKTFRHRRPFEREYNGVKKFEPVSRFHEGLVDILQVGRNEAGGYFYCVMELADDAVSGQKIDPEIYSPRTLAQELVRRKQLPAQECQQIGVVIASALEFLHGRGLIHRDIKPSNIVFVNGVPKLADIGLVVELSEARSYVGTDGFIPPEGPGTFQADIYSFGKVLYEISTGKDRHDYPELPTRLGDPVEETALLALNKIILKACRTEPAQRYQSAGTMAADLTALTCTDDEPVGVPSAIPSTRSRQGLGVVIAIAAMSGVVITVLLLANRKSGPASAETGVMTLEPTVAAKLPQAVRAPEGLIAWWKGEGDTDGAGNHVIAQLDGIEFGRGKVGQGFEFDGAPHRVNVSNAPALNFGPGQDFSIEAWILPLQADTDYGQLSIISKAFSPHDTQFLGYHLQLSNGRLRIAIADTLREHSFVIAEGGPDLRDGRFHHVAVSVRRDSRTGGALLVDGKVVLTFDPTSKRGDLSNSEPLRIGYHPCADFRTFFKGTIDELSVYRRALSAEEIQSIHAAGSAGKHNPNLSSSTFEASIDLSAPGGPMHTVGADLDGDGKPDIAVVHSLTHALSIYRNRSTNGALDAGSFDLPVMLSVGTGRYDPYELEAWDVDGDGKPDLLVPELGSNRLAVLKNNSRVGTLSFAPPVFFALGNFPRGLAVQDLDGDGRPDVAVVNMFSDTISILRNTSVPGQINSESFAPKVDLTVGAPRHDGVPGDLDGDGKPDPARAGARPHQVAAADLDGDGRADLAVVNHQGTNVSIFRNVASPGRLGADSFVRGPDLPATEHNITVATGDLDGDGKPELLTGSTNHMVSVYRNISSPGTLSADSFAPPVEFRGPGWVHNIVLADFNEDRKPDVAVVTQMASRLSVFQNLSVPGQFTAASLGPRLDFRSGDNANGLSTADMDGDGLLDCVFANYYSGTISICRNAGLSRHR